MALSLLAEAYSILNEFEQTPFRGLPSAFSPERERLPTFCHFVRRSIDMVTIDCVVTIFKGVNQILCSDRKIFEIRTIEKNKTFFFLLPGDYITLEHRIKPEFLQKMKEQCRVYLYYLSMGWRRSNTKWIKNFTIRGEFFIGVFVLFAKKAGIAIEENVSISSRAVMIQIKGKDLNLLQFFAFLQNEADTRSVYTASIKVPHKWIQERVTGKTEGFFRFVNKEEDKMIEELKKQAKTLL